ncbi:hypothetical protein BDP27DRAFT_1370461 [Rhodocollybia butyracea]|uniref:Uncharacterized protein n=1 Tax=Rhodocollybia butyracea TaxID=206335 RepID=A0A9P5P8Z7_9AGAR|nr:hypothetical protein BDP27DRAFT_1370461 [Rhodocollybia butyracea]
MAYLVPKLLLMIVWTGYIYCQSITVEVNVADDEQFWPDPFELDGVGDNGAVTTYIQPVTNTIGGDSEFPVLISGTDTLIVSASGFQYDDKSTFTDEGDVTAVVLAVVTTVSTSAFTSASTTSSSFPDSTSLTKSLTPMPVPSPSPTRTDAPKSVPKQPSKGSAKAVEGGVGGAIIFILILITGWLVRTRRKRQSSVQQSMSSFDPASSRNTSATLSDPSSMAKMTVKVVGYKQSEMKEQECARRDAQEELRISLEALNQAGGGHEEEDTLIRQEISGLIERIQRMEEVSSKYLRCRWSGMHYNKHPGTDITVYRITLEINTAIEGFIFSGPLSLVGVAEDGSMTTYFQTVPVPLLFPTTTSSDWIPITLVASASGFQIHDNIDELTVFCNPVGAASENCQLVQGGSTITMVGDVVATILPVENADPTTALTSPSKMSASATSTSAPSALPHASISPAPSVTGTSTQSGAKKSKKSVEAIAGGVGGAIIFFVILLTLWLVRSRRRRQSRRSQEDISPFPSSLGPLSMISGPMKTISSNQSGRRDRERARMDAQEELRVTREALHRTSGGREGETALRQQVFVKELFHNNYQAFFPGLAWRMGGQPKEVQRGRLKVERLLNDIHISLGRERTPDVATDREALGFGTNLEVGNSSVHGHCTTFMRVIQETAWRSDTMIDFATAIQLHWKVGDESMLNSVILNPPFYISIMRISSAYLVFLVAYVANAAPLVNVTSVQSPAVSTRALTAAQLHHSEPGSAATSSEFIATIISPTADRQLGQAGSRGPPPIFQENIDNSVKLAMKKGDWRA